MIIYFTGTGNSRYVARAIAEKLGDEIISSNEYIKEGRTDSFVSESPYIFVFPVYLSTIPEVFRGFISHSEFDGSREAYFIATCAGTSGSSAVDAGKLCENAGLKYKGCHTVFMPQNYVACFKLYDKEKNESMIRDAEASIDLACEKIRKGEFIESRKAGVFEYWVTKLVEKLYNRFFTTTVKFRAEGSCIGCGLCIKNCPVNAIEMKDGRPVWVKKTCIHCMACINRCPVQAIQYGNNTKAQGRYVCPERPEK